MGVVLGDFPGKKLVHLGAAEMLATILLCYTIAVKEGHVKAWLPTISACGEHPPEQYFFRYGILVGAMLLVILALYIYTADFSFSHNSVNVGLGVTAGLCLGVVAVCAANEDSIVHTTCAVIFFVFEDILMAHITLQSLHSLSKLSVTMKSTCTAVGWLSTIGRLLIMTHYIPAVIHFSSHFDIPALAIVEWSNTFVIMGFYWSFAYDFSPDYFIAAWKTVSSKKEGEEEEIKGKTTKVPLL